MPRVRVRSANVAVVGRIELAPARRDHDYAVPEEGGALRRVWFPLGSNVPAPLLRGPSFGVEARAKLPALRESSYILTARASA